MPGRTHHEHIYRGKPAMEKLSAARIHICGAGALGSNLVVCLARIGVGGLTIIDRDRVEEHNIGTQMFGLEDVGVRKAEILRNVLYRDVGMDADAVIQDVDQRNVAKALNKATIVVDTFDNSKSRRVISEFCREREIVCLHAGVNDEYGEVIWNDKYRVPSDEGIDACDYPLARNLIQLVSTITSECLIRFILTGEKENYSITLADLSISRITDL
jgi:molybdopterin/thiamine biosynthesis adenylyltransferase